MTNEQIYKYAIMTLGRYWSKWAGIYTFITMFGLLGLALIISPLFIDGWKTNDYRFIICIFATLISFCGWVMAVNYAVEHRQRFKRNYTYNLVRVDERNRIAIHNKILHEDSRG